MNLTTTKQLAKLVDERPGPNLASVLAGLREFGRGAGLHMPHRLAMYLAQLAHESVGFQYDREIWGPTAAQRGYEGREDLGNIYPGDGRKFAGHGPMQITGRFNTTEFYEWCCAEFGTENVPNFVEDPELINTDPWEGLSAIWYWITRDLNQQADSGSFIGATKVINGGYNGLSDRRRRYADIAMEMLGYDNLTDFQKAAGLEVDGIVGPNTSSAMHHALTELPSVTFGKGKTGKASASLAEIMNDFIDFLSNLFARA